MLKALKSGQPVRVLGAMSGTSLDGVDAAVIETDGVRITAFAETAFRPYSAAEQQVLREGLGHWSGPAVEAAAELVETAHAEVLSQFHDVDLIGFHGQTLAHDPAGGRTHQAGSGAILAEVLECPVVWDFRSTDVAMGGQGAPLAPFYHFALAQSLGDVGPVAMLNLGGVGNLTWIDPAAETPDAPGALLAFDTGPANAPINDLMQARLGRPYDADGILAANGQVDRDIVDDFVSHTYFQRLPPKSLDRDDFAGLLDAVAGLSDVDAAATLTACAVRGVVLSMAHLPSPPRRLLVAGGGRHNAAMMAMLRADLPCAVDPVEDVGLDGDMLEAQAFAYLAARVVRGLTTSAPGTTGVAAAVGGGEISLPGQLAALEIE